MPYDGRVYRVLVASPSDVEEEREIAVQVIQAWNDLHSHARQVVLLPLRWETHTAPEYGVRPQDAINRAIVDECDLLLGIFWTRIGTPTGVAQSGTLEEIARVARAGKPVMLYFSNRGADPDGLDLDQVKKLKGFKKDTYPNALTESYKSAIEFRDKLTRQLELAVRDLQKADSHGGKPPLDLQFISVENQKLSGDVARLAVEIPEAEDLQTWLHNIEDKHYGEQVKLAVATEIWKKSTVPAVLAIINTVSSGIRNVYVEMLIQVCKGDAEVTDNDPFRLRSTFVFMNSIGQPSEFETKLAQLTKQGFSKGENGWNFSLEWDAIQPQRFCVIRPIPFITAKSSAEISFQAKVYADSFPQPLSLCAKMELDVRTKKMTVNELLSLAEIKRTTIHETGHTLNYDDLFDNTNHGVRTGDIPSANPTAEDVRPSSKRKRRGKKGEGD